MSNPYANLTQEANPYAALAEPPSLGRQMLEGAWQGFKTAGPIGASAGFGQPLLDRAAYNVGGKATDVASGAGLPPEYAAGVGLAANVGVQMIPTLAGGAVASAAARPAARWLMNSALKPSLKAHKTGQAVTAVNTMLDEGLNATGGGLGKLEQRINAAEDALEAAISKSPASINKGAVASRLQDTVRRFEEQADPIPDVNTLEGLWTRFLAAHPDQIPVQRAQAIKRGTNQLLRDKYGTLGTADIEGQKALVRGLKEEIATAVPDAAKANARLSQLYPAEDILSRRLMMGANNNPVGLAPIAPNVWMRLMFLADRSPLIKSWLARGLNSGFPGQVVGGGLGALSGRPPSVNE